MASEDGIRSSPAPEASDNLEVSPTTIAEKASTSTKTLESDGVGTEKLVSDSDANSGQQAAIGQDGIELVVVQELESKEAEDKQSMGETQLIKGSADKDEEEEEEEEPEEACFGIKYGTKPWRESIRCEPGARSHA